MFPSSFFLRKECPACEFSRVVGLRCKGDIGVNEPLDLIQQGSSVLMKGSVSLPLHTRAHKRRFGWCMGRGEAEVLSGATPIPTGGSLRILVVFESTRDRANLIRVFFFQSLGSGSL